MTATALSAFPINSEKSLEKELNQLIAQAASFKRKKQWAEEFGAKGLAYTYYKQFKATMMLIDDLKREIQRTNGQDT